MKRWRFYILAIIVLALGFWLWGTLPAFTSPEEAAHQYWFRVNRNAPLEVTDFQALAVRQTPQGILVLGTSTYTYEEQGREPVHNISYVLVGDGPFGYYAKSGHSTGTSSLPELVFYARDQKDNQQIIYGQFLSDEAAVVEVDFQTGETFRDDGENGAFAILAPGNLQFKELRVIASNGTVLKRYTQPDSFTLLAPHKQKILAPVRETGARIILLRELLAMG